MRKTLPRKVAGLLLAVVLLPYPHAWAANFKLTMDPQKTCSAIEIAGELQVGDYDRFVALSKQAAALAPLRRIYLNSGGGVLGTALAITEAIRNIEPTVETIVETRHTCNSACVIILTAGSRHNVSTDAKLTIHQAFDPKTGERDAELTKKIGQYLALNGMPPDVMWTMDKLTPDERLIITPANAKRLGFGSINFYGSSNPPATPQCSWVGFILKGP